MTTRRINTSTIIHLALIVFISFSTTKSLFGICSFSRKLTFFCLNEAPFEEHSRRLRNEKEPKCKRKNDVCRPTNNSQTGSKALCQEEDSLRTAQLIKQANDLFLRPYAQGIFLSPFELRQHHRDQTIKNIEWVKAFDLYRETSSKTDTIPFVVKDNQTVILKPDERFNSWTYSYRDDGRIHKIFRGQHLDDLFVIDEDRFLIQHGFGGELKKAKRKGKLFEWYNVRNGQLEYVISYDERNRVSNIKTMGHYFGPGVECQVEVYAWEEKRIITKNTLMKFKNGSADTTFLKFAYDQLGLIQSISQRKGGQVNWSTTQFETNIEYLENKHLNITISGAGNLLFSITFDHYDNIIEINTPANRKRVNIKYRKRRRWN